MGEAAKILYFPNQEPDGEDGEPQRYKYLWWVLAQYHLDKSGISAVTSSRLVGSDLDMNTVNGYTEIMALVQKEVGAKDGCFVILDWRAMKDESS